MSFRAVRVLKEVDWIAAEDTRRTKQLLSHFGISGKKLISYYDEVERKKAESLISQIKESEKSLALVSDAGTPCVSDPGYHLVRMAHKQSVQVIPIPGPSALTALISVSGLPCDRFAFVGFLPTKKGALEKEIESWRCLTQTIVFYESVRRLKNTLSSIHQMYPEAEVTIGRELTKQYEEVVYNTIAESIQWMDSLATLRGECSVAVNIGEQKNETSSEDIEILAKQEFSSGATIKDVLLLLKDTGIPKNELYKKLLEIKETMGG